METLLPSNIEGKEQLPEELTKEAALALQKVGAYINTQGDPTVMASFKKPPSTMALLGITVVLGFIVWILSAIGDYKNITQNWSHYRCEPSVMPFAKFYGHNLQETMNFCIGEAVKEHAPGVINPIYNAVEDVMSVVDKAYDKAEAIEGGVSGLLKGFESFVLEFTNSLRLVGTQFRMMLVRIKDIFARVYGTFIAFAYAGISAITFGTNLVANPLVSFLDDIGCFGPSVCVVMEDGSLRPVKDIRIGDVLYGERRVTSTYVFDGSRTKMVYIQGIHVSGNHGLFYKNTEQYLRADEHPEHMWANSEPLMYCLATTDHCIPVYAGETRAIHYFTDYEESSDPGVVASAQRIAEMSLNGSHCVGTPVADYSLGLDSRYSVEIEGGMWSPIQSLKVGDTLSDGGKVFGIIQEECADYRITPAGNVVSAAQLILDRETETWVRAAYLYPQSIVTTQPLVLYHLITTSGSGFRVMRNSEVLRVRDYAEVHLQEIQDQYNGVVKNLTPSIWA